MVSGTGGFVGCKMAFEGVVGVGRGAGGGVETGGSGCFLFQSESGFSGFKD